LPFPRTGTSRKRSCYYPGMLPPPAPGQPPPALDVAVSGGTIFGMMRRLFGAVIRASVVEAVTPMFIDLRRAMDERMDQLENRMDRLEARMDRLEAQMDRLDERLDRTENRMDGLEAKIERLRQETNEQIGGLRHEIGQIRKDISLLTVEVTGLRVEVAGLKGDVGTLQVEVSSLKRDRESADNLVHRVTRIEDHLFAKA
jgi:septal ring factor EnvC (AmiA/AmiB activator)